jgi:hypothetical protein
VNLQRAVAFFTILIVILVVAAAFMVLGPPNRERAEALDRQRVADVRRAAEDLADRYTATKQSLPDRLSDPKRDPVTGRPYGYRRVDATHYELCATFDRRSPKSEDPVLDDGAFWRHSAGRACYEFDVRRAVPH